jgi:hypothetical protein
MIGVAYLVELIDESILIAWLESNVKVNGSVGRRIT